MKPSALYLAYGSNLHPLRLQQRLPGCQLLAVVALPGRRLVFHKRGVDGSGKCDLIAGFGDDLSYGALYQLAADSFQQLDRWERGYRRVEVHLRFDQTDCLAFSYQALPEQIDTRLQPFDWYRQLVICGADYLDFPIHYQRQLQQPQGLADEDKQRTLLHQQLLQQLQQYERPGSVKTLPEGCLLSWPAEQLSGG